MSIDFTGYEAEDVLQALIDNAVPPSTFYHKLGKIDRETALAMIQRDHIQYLNGRMLDVSFKQFPLISSAGYDKHHGEGAMARALQLLYDRTLV